LASVRLLPSREADIVEELTQHLQDRHAELLAAGATPDEAARLTLEEFQSGTALASRLTPLRQAHAPMPLTPAAPTGAILTDLWLDVRSALRQFVQQPGFAAVVVVTLAVCLAANLVIFAVVDGVVLRPLPFPDAHRLVAIYNTYPGAGRDIAPNSATDYFDRQSLAALSGLATFQRMGLTLGREGDASERVIGLAASPSLFSLIGTQAWRGRLLLGADAEPGAAQTLLLTYGYWQRAFAGRESAVGDTLHVNGAPFTVVGVLPAHWRFIDPSVEVVIPAVFSQAERAPTQRHRNNNWRQVARLAPDATLVTLQSQLDALNAANAEQTPELRQTLVDIGFTTRAVPFQSFVAGEAARSLYLLWGGALVVLLIAGVNLANMVLVRTSTRRREWATRLALGAGSRRLLRHSLIDAWVLAAAGTAGGLLLGGWALTLAPRLGLDALPRGTEIALDWRVTGFILAIAALASTILGVLPLIAHRPGRLGQFLREEGRTGTSSRTSRVAGRGLAAVQIACALVLLVAGLALLASFQRILDVDLGFRTPRLLTAQLTLPGARYPSGAVARRFASDLLARVRALPGVESAGIASATPFGGTPSNNVVFAEGYQMAPGESVVSANHVSVSGGYFETIGALLVAGRWFDDGDADGRRRVIVIDERLARRFFPNGDALGQRMWTLRNTSRMNEPPPESQMLTVVGVVAEVRLTDVVDDPGVRTHGVCYYPFEQQPMLTAGLALRTAGDPTLVVGGVRRALATLDPQLPLYGVADVDTLIDRSLFDRRTPAILAGGFALVALMLATLGVYGVLAYQVAQRRCELGIRMALGADGRRVFRLVLSEGLVIVCGGAAVGLLGAAAMRRGLDAQLYGVGALDPVILSAVLGLLAAVTFVAIAIPARRAARTDPMVAMSGTD
jgi:predicted permease